MVVIGTLIGHMDAVFLAMCFELGTFIDIDFFVEVDFLTEVVFREAGFIELDFVKGGFVDSAFVEDAFELARMLRFLGIRFLG